MLLGNVDYLFKSLTYLEPLGKGLPPSIGGQWGIELLHVPTCRVLHVSEARREKGLPLFLLILGLPL